MRSSASLILIGSLFAGGCQGEGNVAAAETQEQKPPEGYNRLYFETSPYLKLHETNPVDWHPWGDAAFKKAKDEDKLVFLSIGYSTCHWCHVMEEESFADEDVAAVMNKSYIAIKVDREMMPDVDHVYMQVTQAMTGRGGWPNTLLLTPDRKPIFAATYIPKDALIELLTNGAKLWTEQRELLVEDSERISLAIQGMIARTNVGLVPESTVQAAADQLMGTYDEEFGGFGTRPKFPSPINLVFMLRAADRTGDESYKDAALDTLTKMRHGGIYDQIGFGFHRYSTDQIWRIPHFEKMLYDQAMHVLAYAEGYQASGNELYRRTAEEILTYVDREMSDPDGGFWSAQDADSEGEEGKYYVWSEEEMAEVLNEEELKKAKRWFKTTESGNFIDEATQEETGSNVLELRSGTPASDNFDEIREKLLKARSTRVPPLTDDKVLTDWNGLMIAAYARAGAAFDDERWVARAQKAVKFVRSTMLAEDGTLTHSYRQGKTQGTGHLDDYAYLIWGLVELYEADFDAAHLELAAQLADVLEKRFFDSRAGGFFTTASGVDVPIARAKKATDGALPSGSSVAAYSLVRLGRLLAKKDLEDLGKSVVETFGGDIVQSPSAFIGLLLTTDFLAGPTSEVVVVGEREAALAMIRSLQSEYSPRTVFLLKDVADSSTLDSIAPYTKLLVAQGGKATAYVCQDYTCDLPTTDVREALAGLRRANGR
ncbi:MAG: thioredoxin domain-containing protein [Armatimonadetes bacterium]|nr:thioredoxin domain-containing protein [Armatimonadota bacterium]